MSRRQKDPLRALSAEERTELTRLSRSRSAPAARATALLAPMGRAIWRRHARPGGATTTRLRPGWRASIARACQPSGRGMVGHRSAMAQQRILAEVRRPPDRERDGTATWSLSTLQRALPRAGDGLARVSTYTIWKTLHAAGLSGQHSRTWCETGVVLRKRKRGGPVVVHDPDALGKKR